MSAITLTIIYVDNNYVSKCNVMIKYRELWAACNTTNCGRGVAEFAFKCDTVIIHTQQF